MTITAAMIIMNEEMNIPFSLHNPLLVYDRVLIVDGGSKDNTLKVAEQKARELGMEHKLEIRVNPFRDLNSQRNYYLQHIKTDFLHYIDGDEIYKLEHLQKLKDIYINQYQCIQIRSFHFYLDMYHEATRTATNSWGTSWKMAKCFKNIIGHMRYGDFQPLVGDHDLFIDNVYYMQYWSKSTLLCDINDIACYHIGHALGKDREHKRLMFQIKYEDPNLRISEAELSDRAWKSCYFDSRAWNDHINPDPIGIQKFTGEHPEILKTHPVYPVRVIND